MALTAIPTVYAGVRFRSHLEARWALFYDDTPRLCAAYDAARSIRFPELVAW